MIISRTPYRISFFGGGTDFPGWYREHGGAVLASTIDKYCYLTCRRLPPFFDHKFRVVWSKIENVAAVGEIEHPAVREIIDWFGFSEVGIEVSHQGDLPARSGMGSSSSFTVGMINCLAALSGKMLTKAELAKKAIFVEQEILKENVGSQDQVCAAYGGFNLINFSRSGDVSVIPLTIGSQRIQRLEKHLMLFFTGISRESSKVQESFVKDINGRRRQLRVLTDLVEEGVQLLNGDFPLRDFGELLHESWDLKRSLSESVSSPAIDKMYELARGAGAVGGKVTGAGGGGFFLLFVEEKNQAGVRDALRHCIHVPFQFEYGGSQIIFADQDPEYSGTSELEIRARWEKLEEDLVHEQ